MKVFLLLACVLVLLPAKGKAQQLPHADLERIQQEQARQEQVADELKRRSQTITGEITGARRQLVNQARRVMDFETQLQAIEKEHANIEARAAQKQKELLDSNHDLVNIIAAIQVINHRPNEALLLQPLSPKELIQSVYVIRSALPQVRGRIETVEGQLLEIAALRQQLQERQNQIMRASAQLNSEQNRLNAMIRNKTSIQQQLTQQQREAQRKSRELAQSARDIKELITKLQEQQTAAPRPSPRLGEYIANAARAPAAFASYRGKLSPPVVGFIVRNFGDSENGAVTSRGMTFAVRKDAQVVAPFDGMVLYADVFRGYGPMVIIQHDQRYHSLLAGMDRLDVSVGDSVLAGEPVGIAGNSSNRVYFELRQGTTAINPKPWLTNI